jgi:hypothetical protein
MLRAQPFERDESLLMFGLDADAVVSHGKYLSGASTRAADVDPGPLHTAKRNTGSLLQQSHHTTKSVHIAGNRS